MPKVAERSDLSVVETDLMSRINQLCLATTNAGVRVAALSALAALAARLPKDHALRSLSTIHKVDAVLCFPAFHLLHFICNSGSSVQGICKDIAGWGQDIWASLRIAAPRIICKWWTKVLSPYQWEVSAQRVASFSPHRFCVEASC